jgi:hypothetical protein
MSRPIAYNASGPLSGSIRGGSVNYTVDSGNRDYTTFASKKWVPSADGVAPIVFVTDSYTQGIELNPSLAVPLFFSCNGTGSAAILYTANRLPGSPGNYSDANVALNDLISARGYFILESNDPFEGVDADSLTLDLDAAKMSSYPQTGTNWRDLSGQGNTGALTNGPTWNSNGWFTFDGVDDYVQINNIPSLRPANELTIEMVVRAVTTTAGWNLLYGQNPYSGGQLVFLETGGTLIRALHFVNGTEYRCNTNESISTSVFKHVVFTFKTGDAIRSYFNGTPSTVTSLPAGTFTYNTSNPYFLSYYGANIPNIQYSLARSYASALTGAQVKQNYFGSPIVTDGLVFAVDANNLVSYPKSGTSWYNLTGSVASGSLINGPTFSPSNGGSIVFDGVDDYIRTTYNSAYDFSNANFSMEAWFYSNPTANGNYTSICNRATYGSNERSFELFIANDTGTPYIWFGVFNSNWTYVNNSSLTGIQFNEWNHVIATSDGVGNGKVYINGVLRQTNSSFNTAVTATTVPFLIGAYVGGAVGGFFNGKIPIVKLYNKALTSDEVQQNYQATKDKFLGQNIVTNGLVLNLDAANKDSYPGTGTTWYDLSGNGYNGTKQGTQSPTYPLWNSTGYFIFSGGTLGTNFSSFYVPGLPAFSGLSVFAWVRTADASESKTILRMQNSDFELSMNGSNQLFYAAGANYDNINTTYNYSFADGNWHYMGLTYDGNNLKAYWETTNVANNSRGSVINTEAGDLNIGTRNDAYYQHFVGDIGVIQIYNKVLTSTEITQNYNAQKTRFGL